MQTSEITIIFPHQLFEHHPAITKGRKIVLVEETLYFNQFNFHKQKLVLHRASMQFYLNWLKEKKYDVNYIEAKDANADIRKCIEQLSRHCKEIHIADVTDDSLTAELLQLAKSIK